jgi:hypothetical protein
MTERLFLDSREPVSLPRRAFWRIRFAVKWVVWHLTIITEVCWDCGAQVGLYWHASDELWALVMGEPGGLLCVRCFDRRAWDQGRLLRWEPILDGRRQP